MKYSFKCFEDEVCLYLSRNHTMPKFKDHCSGLLFVYNVVISNFHIS